MASLLNVEMDTDVPCRMALVRGFAAEWLWAVVAVREETEEACWDGRDAPADSAARALASGAVVSSTGCAA